MTTSAAEFANTVAELMNELARGVTVGEDGQNRPWRRESLADGYRWLKALEGSTRALSGATICSECGGSGWVLAIHHWNGTTVLEHSPGRRVRCERCTPAIGSDPTGSSALASPAIKAKADNVAKHVKKALAEVRGAVNELQEAIALFDRDTPTDLPNERAMPRTTTKAEQDQVRKAQARRSERQEGFGSG